MKKFKVTHTKQQVAVDILTELRHWIEQLPNGDTNKETQGIFDIHNKIFKKYKLTPDMFASTDSNSNDENCVSYIKKEHEI